MCFGFYLANSECGACLAVDYSLVYSYPKLCLLFFSLILLEPDSKPSFSNHPSFVLLFAPGPAWRNRNSVINFPQLVNLVYPFLIHDECWSIQTGRICFLLSNIAFFLYVFITFLSLVLHTKCRGIISRLLKLLVAPPTYLVIYSEKYPSIWANFNHVSEVFQGLFFAFLL